MMMRKLIRACRLAAAVSVVTFALAGAAFIGSSSEGTMQPRAAEAGPTAMVGLNGGMCVAMSVAFAGLESVDAVSACGLLMSQDAASSFQQLVRCLRGSDADTETGVRDGKVSCLPFDLSKPPIRPAPEELAVIDRDKNYVHGGQQLIVIAFVNDDAPVRFHTDTGTLLHNPLVGGGVAGKDWYCQTGSPLTDGDPDCDGDPATVGDGVVVAKIQIDPNPSGDDLGDHEVLAIQEGIGFPMTFRVQDRPEDIELSYLFAKNTVQTGATDPPAVGEPIEATDCVFSGSVSGVLAANSSPYKSIVLAKSLTDDGEEVIGVLLDWEPVFSSTVPADEDDIGGVALPQTPTLDTGAIGIGFPQFFCGKEKPGTLTLKATVNGLLSGNALQDEAEIDLTVVGPPSSMTLAANPPAIVCDGVNTSTVTATMTTADGGKPANGVDVAFSAAALGTVNPLTADATDGVATTTVAPLSNVARGVAVLARVDDVSLEDPVEASTLIECLPGGAPPPGGQPAGGGSAPPPGGSGQPGGVITGPDTGSGGDVDGHGALSVWPAIALFAGAMGLVGARFALRRDDA